MYEGLSAEAMGYGDLQRVARSEREAAGPGGSPVVYGAVAVLVLVLAGVAYALFW